MKRITVKELENNIDFYLDESSKEDIYVYDENGEDVCCLTDPRKIGKRNN